MSWINPPHTSEHNQIEHIITRLDHFANMFEKMSPGFLLTPFKSTYFNRVGDRGFNLENPKLWNRLLFLYNTQHNLNLVEKVFTSKKLDPLAIDLLLSTLSHSSGPSKSPSIGVMIDFLEKSQSRDRSTVSILKRIARGIIQTSEQALEIERAQRQFEQVARVKLTEAGHKVQKALGTHPQWVNLSVTKDDKAYLTSNPPPPGLPLDQIARDGVPPTATNDELWLNLNVGVMSGMDQPYTVIERSGDDYYGAGFEYKLPGGAWQKPDRPHTAVQLPEGAQIRTQRHLKEHPDRDSYIEFTLPHLQ